MTEVNCYISHFHEVLTLATLIRLGSVSSKSCLSFDINKRINRPFKRQLQFKCLALIAVCNLQMSASEKARRSAVQARVYFRSPVFTPHVHASSRVVRHLRAGLYLKSEMFLTLVFQISNNV